MKRKPKTTSTQDPRPVSHYPDRELAQALWKAVKVLEADPDRARVWQRACVLVQQQGTTRSFGGGGNVVSPISLHRLGPDAEFRQRFIDAAHWILASAVSMGTMAADYRNTLADCARFFDAPRPSVQNRRASAAKQFIRQRFARTGKPVSATLIGNHLRVSRDIVKKHIYPLLHQDTGFTLTGRGPAAGWKPRD